jgi:hypothetical protein
MTQSIFTPRINIRNLSIMARSTLLTNVDQLVLSLINDLIALVALLKEMRTVRVLNPIVELIK